MVGAKGKTMLMHFPMADLLITKKKTVGPTQENLDKQRDLFFLSNGTQKRERSWDWENTFEGSFIFTFMLSSSRK